MRNRCEDYPCCGHTDGLPCNWTYTPEAQAFDRIHAFCDHEAGFCEVDEAIDSALEDDDEDYEDSEDPSYYINADNEAQLAYMEDQFGMEPAGWEDSY